MTLGFVASDGSGSWGPATEEEALQDLEIKPNTEVIWFPEVGIRTARSRPSQFRDEVRLDHNRVIDLARTRAEESTTPLPADVKWLMTDQWTCKRHNAILTFRRTEALTTSDVEERLKLSDSVSEGHNLFYTGGLLTRLPFARFWTTGAPQGENESGVIGSGSVTGQFSQPSGSSPAPNPITAWTSTNWRQRPAAPVTDGGQQGLSWRQKASAPAAAQGAHVAPQDPADGDAEVRVTSRKKVDCLRCQPQSFFDYSDKYEIHRLTDTLPAELASSSSGAGVRVFTFRRPTGALSSSSQATNAAFEHLALSRRTVTTSDEEYNKKYPFQLEEIYLAGSAAEGPCLKVKMAKRCTEADVHQCLAKATEGGNSLLMGARVTRFA